jgi:hypothetical protein
MTVSFRMLYQALLSPHAFDQLYRIIVRKAVRTFRLGHRQRSVTWLQYNLGELLLYDIDLSLLQFTLKKNVF